MLCHRIKIRTESRKNGGIVMKATHLIVQAMLIILIVITLPVFLIAQEKKHRYELGSEIRTLYSTIRDQKYDLYINLPRGYESDSTRTYPVLYALDGQWFFEKFVSGYNGQYYDGLVPEIIIVGITWAGENANYDSLRAIDYSPTAIKESKNSTGGAKKFLDVLKHEIIPFIEKEYRTISGNRALAGSSLSGLFTFYSLFHETDLFNSYIISSPVLGWDNKLPFKYEEEYASQHSDLNARVYMAIGEYEYKWGGEDFQTMFDRLKSRDYIKLQLESRIIDGMGHGGSPSEAFIRGMIYIYKRPSLMLPQTLLEEFSGIYVIAPVDTIEMIVDSGHLVQILPQWGSTIKLYAMSNSDFYMLGYYYYYHFKRSDNGEVVGFDGEYFGGNFYAKKIK